jgi:signal transduction histidine kinase
MRDKMNKDLINRLESLPGLNHIPRQELDWLVHHGNLDIHQSGLIALKGTRIENLWIILEGHISVHIDRGAGPKVVNTELYKGSVTGMLPYSRLLAAPGDTYADERTEIFSISIRHFPEMINKCPLFTAHTVHTMIDRTRIHNTSAMQDEKMISIGRLAAGLAHELNNPASVAIRDAKLLRECQTDADNASHILNNAGLSDKHFMEIKNMCSACIDMSDKVALLPLQKSDLHDKITDWLEQHDIDTIDAGQLVDLAVTTEDLDKLQIILPENVFETALKWIVARCNIHNLTVEIEQSTIQIHKLVEAVKKFTYMDNLAEKELVDIETGVCDSLRVLDSKLKSKNADIMLKIDKNLPKVYANGAALNQIWFSLLDNALDAIPKSGKIHIRAGLETNFIAVRIIDNGPGIPPDKIDRIFDPFYTTKPPGQGTGLGLDLSRRLLRRYNGDIHVHSTAGKTEFCVNLSNTRA